MYESIYAYAEQNGLTTDKYFEKRKVIGYIHITSDGDYEYFESFKPEEAGYRMCPKRFSGGNDAPCFIVEKLNKYVVNEKWYDLSDDQKKYKNAIIRRDLYRECMQEAENIAPSIAAVCAFLTKLENDEFKQRFLQDIANSGIKPESYVSWKVDGKRIEDDDTWKPWYRDIIDSKTVTLDRVGTSIISGKEVSYGAQKFPKVDGSVLGSGVPIFSNSHKKCDTAACAFKSYGADVPYEACCMSVEEAEAIAAGLDKLISSENNINKQFEVLYWYDRDEQVNPMNVLSDTEAETVWRDALESVVKKGAITEGRDDQDFYMHVMGYRNPTKGRFYLTNEQKLSYNNTCRNVLQWYRDSTLRLEVYNKNTEEYVITDKELKNAYSVLKQTMTHINSTDAKMLKKEHGEDINGLMNAILQNRQIPHRIYQRALRQAERYTVLSGFPEAERRSINITLQIIKIYLLRTGKDYAMSEMLRTENTNPGYLCGRVIAIMDALQRKALGNVGTKVSQKCIKIIGTKTTLGMIMALEHKEDYLRKLEGSGETGAKYASIYRKMLDDTLNLFDVAFPKKLNEEEQGSLYIGMAQQNVYMKEQAKAAKEAKEAREAEKAAAKAE